MPDGNPPTPRPEDVKALGDRDLLEAIYRAIYGEEPIQPGLARRVTRLERAVLFLILTMVGAGLIQVVPGIGLGL